MFAPFPLPALTFAGPEAECVVPPTVAARHTSGANGNSEERRTEQPASSRVTSLRHVRPAPDGTGPPLSVMPDSIGPMGGHHSVMPDLIGHPGLWPWFPGSPPARG